VSLMMLSVVLGNWDQENRFVGGASFSASVRDVLGVRKSGPATHAHTHARAHAAAHVFASLIRK
jgi:hypothetical protein